MTTYMDYIEVDPKRMFGKPTIKGTRITVEMILEDLAAQKTVDDIVTAHPGITKESIQAALIFAADAIKGERVYTVTG